MPTVEFYNNEIAVKKKLLNQVITYIGMTDDSENILTAIKSVESLENVDTYEEFTILIETITSKILSMDLTSFTGQDLLLLTRAFNLKDIPIGSEERCQQLTLDEKKMDVYGDAIVGERTLEAFEDRVLEVYYRDFGLAID